MHCSHWKPHVLCGLAVLLFSGCHWYSPYGYGYPGTYAPPGTVMPQQTFPGAPPGTFQQSPPALAPGGSSGSNFLSPTPSSPNGGNNSAPLWNPNSSGTSTNEKPVPQPFGDPNSFEGPGASTFEDDGKSTPFSQMSGERVDDGVQHAATPESDSFESPVALDPEAAHRGPNGAVIPYGFDDKGYTWLRGVVDHVEEDDSWHIIFDPRPTRNDKLHGAVHLIHDERFVQLHDGDVVKIVGEIDYDTRDPRGKPMYRVAELGRYRPAANSAMAN